MRAFCEDGNKMCIDVGLGFAHAKESTREWRCKRCWKLSFVDLGRWDWGDLSRKGYRDWLVLAEEECAPFVRVNYS